MIVTNGKVFVVNPAPWRKPRTSASRLPIRNTHRPLMAGKRPIGFPAADIQLEHPERRR
jgi:hypothetical protein